MCIRDRIFTRVKMPRQYRSSRITKEDVRSLLPAVSDEKELAVLLGGARSVYSCLLYTSRCV